MEHFLRTSILFNATRPYSGVKCLCIPFPLQNINQVHETLNTNPSCQLTIQCWGGVYIISQIFFLILRIFLSLHIIAHIQPEAKVLVQILFYSFLKILILTWFLEGVDSSMNFNACSDSCYYQYKQNTEHFYHPPPSKSLLLYLCKHTFPKSLAFGNHSINMFVFANIVYKGNHT